MTSIYLSQWRKIYNRFYFFLQKKFALTSSVTSVAAYFVTRNTAQENIGWLVTGSMMLGIPVITILTIVPVNNQLLETENCIKEKGMCVFLMFLAFRVFLMFLMFPVIWPIKSQVFFIFILNLSKDTLCSSKLNRTIQGIQRI